MPVNPKLKAGGGAAAVATVLVYVAGLLGVDLPSEVAMALGTLAFFAAGYVKRA